MEACRLLDVVPHWIGLGQKDMSSTHWRPLKHIWRGQQICSRPCPQGSCPTLRLALSSVVVPLQGTMKNHKVMHCANTLCTKCSSPCTAPSAAELPDDCDVTTAPILLHYQ